MLPDVAQDVEHEVVVARRVEQAAHLARPKGRRRRKGGEAAQRAGLEAVRELRGCVNKVLVSGRHTGMQRAREEANLAPLTAYDCQVQESIFLRI